MSVAAAGSKSLEVPARSYQCFGGPFRCSSLLLGGATTTLVGERLGCSCGFKACRMWSCENHCRVSFDDLYHVDSNGIEPSLTPLGFRGLQRSGLQPVLPTSPLPSEWRFSSDNHFRRGHYPVCSAETYWKLMRVLF